MDDFMTQISVNEFLNENVFNNASSEHIQSLSFKDYGKYLDNIKETTLSGFIKFNIITSPYHDSDGVLFKINNKWHCLAAFVNSTVTIFDGELTKKNFSTHQLTSFQEFAPIPVKVLKKHSDYGDEHDFELFFLEPELDLKKITEEFMKEVKITNDELNRKHAREQPINYFLRWLFRRKIDYYNESEKIPEKNCLAYYSQGVVSQMSTNVYSMGTNQSRLNHAIIKAENKLVKENTDTTNLKNKKLGIL